MFAFLNVHFKPLAHSGTPRISHVFFDSLDAQHASPSSATSAILSPTRLDHMLVAEVYLCSSVGVRVLVFERGVRVLVFE